MEELPACGLDALALRTDGGSSGWPTRQKVVLAACACAETALKFVKAGEVRPAKAIEVARAWARGEATLAQVRDAADAAFAAYGYAAAYSAAHSYAAAAADHAAAAAADAADDAAYAAAAAADARAKALAEMADIVRGMLEIPKGD